MVDVTATDVEEFAIEFPPNARMSSVEFSGSDLRVMLEDGGAERIVSASDIAALHGASIGREITLPDSSRRSSLMARVVGLDPVETQIELQHVVGIRPASVGELWYLVADTFNFRAALGAQTTLLLDANLRLFLQRLAAFSPGAVQDAFVTAIIAGSPPPPPIQSIMEFFRAASR